MMIRYLMCILLLLSVAISGCGKNAKITETVSATQNYTVHMISGAKKLPLLKNPNALPAALSMQTKYYWISSTIKK